MGRESGRNSETMLKNWLGLMIGNSRLHWALFSGASLQRAWNSAHLSASQIQTLVHHQMNFTVCLDYLTDDGTADHSPWRSIASDVPPGLPLRIASVIPAQIPLWQAYTQTQVIQLDRIPIQGLYSTLGIDRALALLGATAIYGKPCLVIDAGTALTFTGVDAQGILVGGAILPGLQLQLRSLSDHTAALPYLSSRHTALPPRWSQNTPDAIWSGILYTLLAGIQDFIVAWQQQHEAGAIVLTGGDAQTLTELLLQQAPDLSTQIRVDPQLIFWGMRSIVLSS